MHKFALVKLCVMKIHRIIPHAVVDLVCRCTLSFLRLMMIPNQYNRYVKRTEMPKKRHFIKKDFHEFFLSGKFNVYSYIIITKYNAIHVSNLFCKNIKTLTYKRFLLGKKGNNSLVLISK